jgi:hypothetical protein
MVMALCYKPASRGFNTRQGDFFLIYLIFPAALDRNEYQKHKNNNVSGGKVRRVRRADNLTTIEPTV